jgi:phosphoribosylanthranilate isomerase
MSIQVKICGITSVADAQAVAGAGADLIGLMFYDQSPRHVTLETASEIAQSISPFVVKVGVFVNPTEELVTRAIAECNLSFLQFHGEESPEFCTKFGVMSMKAFRVRDAESLRALEDYNTDAWLLDAYSQGALGGTGEKFNWELAIEARKLGRPIFLAGGLTPDNVGGAVSLVRPFGVDVSSGVEISPGEKDLAKVKLFIERAKAAAMQ